MESDLDHSLLAAPSSPASKEIVYLIHFDCSKQEREQKEDDQPVMWVHLKAMIFCRFKRRAIKECLINSIYFHRRS
jgi:hypothetical protein